MVYVRSPGGVDLSHVIRRVRFHLHPSFAQPERIVDRPPYELEETGDVIKQSRRLTTTALSTAGWGEFEIGVLVEFHDDVVGPPIAMSHSLKLYTTSFAKAWTERADR